MVETTFGSVRPRRSSTVLTGVAPAARTIVVATYVAGERCRAPGTFEPLGDVDGEEELAELALTIGARSRGARVSMTSEKSMACCPSDDTLRCARVHSSSEAGAGDA
jgi:hypothetical protein